MPQIRDHKDKNVRANIRKASSTFEVMAYVVAALTEKSELS